LAEAIREADLMSNTDYREMASEIRALVPKIKHRQAVADLRSLADRYERLAHYLEVAPGELLDTPLEYRRQAG
jgi:hypothetical protein